MKQAVTIIAVLMTLALACQNQSTQKRSLPSGKTAIGYDLEHPAKKYLLPTGLNEISGITSINDSVIACIADEKGIVYFFNLRTGKVRNKLAFAGDDDYEDITAVADTLYILTSAGKVWRVAGFSTNPLVSSFNIATSKQYELEALAAVGNILYTGAKMDRNRKSKPSSLPVWRIDRHESQNITGVFQLPSAISLPNHATASFRLSAFTYLSRQKEWFCISANERLLLRCDSNGVPLGSYTLLPELFEQPEGICTTKEGGLLISNEAGHTKATLLLFNPINEP